MSQASSLIQEFRILNQDVGREDRAPWHIIIRFHSLLKRVFENLEALKSIECWNVIDLTTENLKEYSPRSIVLEKIIAKIERWRTLCVDGQLHVGLWYTPLADIHPNQFWHRHILAVFQGTVSVESALQPEEAVYMAYLRSDPSNVMQYLTPETAWTYLAAAEKMEQRYPALIAYIKQHSLTIDSLKQLNPLFPHLTRLYTSATPADREEIFPMLLAIAEKNSFEKLASLILFQLIPEYHPSWITNALCAIAPLVTRFSVAQLHKLYTVAVHEREERNIVYMLGVETLEIDLSSAFLAEELKTLKHFIPDFRFLKHVIVKACSPCTRAIESEVNVIIKTLQLVNPQRELTCDLLI